MLDPIKRIRLFIVESEPLVAAGLHHFLETDDYFRVIGTSAQVRPVLLRTIRPDILLLSAEHGSGNLCEAIAAAKTAVEATKIIVLSCHAHSELVARAFHAGASGYVSKDIAPGDFIGAVKSVAGGQPYGDPRTAGLVRRRQLGGRNPLNMLTERETEIVKLIAGGHSNRTISETLGLSEKTIKNHISRIFAKLHITARTQAVLHAIETGIA